MSKQFYSHLVQIDFLHEELDSLNLKPHEKEELLRHVHGSIHMTVLDVVLSDLPEEHKKTFLEHVAAENQIEVWRHLIKHTVGMEEKIKDKIIALAKEFAEDVKKTKAPSS